MKWTITAQLAKPTRAQPATLAREVTQAECYGWPMWDYL